MIAIDLLPERVSDFIAAVRGWQNLDGFVVTIPHKAAVAGLINDLSETAQFLGVANVVRRHPDGRLFGDMTDGEGFLSACRGHGFDPSGKVVLLVGAGAAGSAIGYSLAKAGISQLFIHDRHEDRAESLAARLANAFAGVAIVTGEIQQHGFDLVINASSSGMQTDDPLPVPEFILDMMPPGGLVADVVTSPEITPMLSLARQRGLKIQTGSDMAKAQVLALGKAMGIIDQGLEND